MILTIEDELIRFLCQPNVLTENRIILAAISGGPDSAAMLHALSRLQKLHRFKVIAAHLNHSIRGDEADEDSLYVEQLCEGLQIEAVIEKVDVPELKLELHLSMQEAARTARHSFLRRVAAERSIDRIAYAHTRDDLVETALLNIFRGTGLEGLTGLSSLDPPVIRPILNIKKSETSIYCSQHHLNPRQDSSNADKHYRRNRLRTELLPSLRAYFNTDVDSAIIRMCQLCNADNALIDEITAQFLSTKISVAENFASVLITDLAPEPIALQRRVVRSMIEKVRGTLHGVEFSAVERLLNSSRLCVIFGEQLPMCNGLCVRLISNEVMIKVEKVV